MLKTLSQEDNPDPTKTIQISNYLKAWIDFSADLAICICGGTNW